MGASTKASTQPRLPASGEPKASHRQTVHAERLLLCECVMRRHERLEPCAGDHEARTAVRGALLKGWRSGRERAPGCLSPQGRSQQRPPLPSRRGASLLLCSRLPAYYQQSKCNGGVFRPCQGKRGGVTNLNLPQHVRYSWICLHMAHCDRPTQSLNIAWPEPTVSKRAEWEWIGCPAHSPTRGQRKCITRVPCSLLLKSV